MPKASPETPRSSPTAGTNSALEADHMENSSVPSSEILALHERFREIKHSVNNTIAVMMALSELAQRNPTHYEKLTQAVLTRCPEIVSQLQGFQQELLSKVNPELVSKGLPPMSGRL
jgi:hypothetical protein